MTGGEMRINRGEEVYELDEFGNIIVMNGTSRSGGILNEWNRTLDSKDLKEELIDGYLMRQGIRSHGIPKSFTTGQINPQLRQANETHTGRPFGNQVHKTTEKLIPNRRRSIQTRVWHRENNNRMEFPSQYVEI